MATQKRNLKEVFQRFSDKKQNTFYMPDKEKKGNFTKDKDGKFIKSEPGKGDFKMATGGGTPIPKGEKLKDHPEVHRVEQPRDKDGQFTYNAVNNIPLKYGPTRGTTIPPLLQGMKINFAQKSNKTVVLDGLTYVAKMDFTKEEFMEMLKDYSIENYVDENGETKGRVVWNNLPNVGLERKKGRKSQAEKDMITKGEEGFVNPDTTIMEGRNKRPDGPRTPSFVNKKPGSSQIGETPEDGYNPLSPNSTNSTSDDNAGSPSQKSTSEQPQKNSVDTGMAKENPVEFGKKYQNEINEIKKLDPKMTASKIINAFATGKIKSFDQLRKMIELKNSGNKPTKPDDSDTPNRK